MPGDTLTVYTTLKAYKVIYDGYAHGRQADIVLRCFLYEICKIFKDYNIKLMTSLGKEVTVPNVIRKKIKDVFVWSRSGDHIKTELNVWYGLILVQS